MKFTTVSPEEAVKVIKSGDRVHLSSVAVTPHCLIKPMVERGRRKEFNNVNPAYIQIKNGFNYTDNINNAIVAISGIGTPSKPKKISVNNIVADKINLLTYNGSPNFNLTERDTNGPKKTI